MTPQALVTHLYKVHLAFGIDAGRALPLYGHKVENGEFHATVAASVQGLDAPNYDEEHFPRSETRQQGDYPLGLC